jgi:hypothetical protein
MDERAQDSKELRRATRGSAALPRIPYFASAQSLPAIVAGRLCE